MMQRKAITSTILLLAFIGVIHVFVVRGGETAFYSALADGFMHGHLSIPTPPSPLLLKLADPYNPDYTHGIRIHDAVLFEGKYYVYWGPVPALLIIPLCLAFGQTHPNFGDQFIAFGLALGVLIVAASFLLKIQRNYFESLRFTRVAAMIVSLGLGTPMLFMSYRAAVYEAAILGGQVFLLAGIWSAWIGVRRSERPVIPLFFAGVFWTLSAGSRISLAPAIAVIGLLTIVQLRKGKYLLAGAVSLLAPLLIGAALFAWYNDARFHSVTEFGLRYQLAAANQNKMAMSDYSSPRFILPNLVNYLFAKPARSSEFPYLRVIRPRWMTGVFDLGGKYRVEPVVGLCWTQPLLILSLVSLAWRRSDPSGRWLVRILWAAVIVGFLPPLMMNGATMRYLMDMIPCCTVLAAVGFWRIIEMAENRPRVREYVELAVGLLVVLQCALGVLVTS